MSLRRRFGALLLGLTLALGGAAPAVSAGPAKTRDFIDVSSNNPLPDLSVYAQTHSRLGVKANEGTDYVWGDGLTVADQAHARGLEVWHYDFARPGRSRAADEATLLVRTAKAHWRPGDRIVLDLEDAGQGTSGGLSDNQLAGWVRAYAATAEQAGLGKLVVYSGWWFVGPRPLTRTAIDRRDFWFAAYQSAVPQFNGLNVVAWQFTDREVVAGESRPVDASHDLTPAPKPAVKPTPASCGWLWWTDHGCFKPQTIPADAAGVSRVAAAYAFWNGHGWTNVHRLPSHAHGVRRFTYTSAHGWVRNPR